ncbi:unnamed protein product [Didymodactylos carnosus]|uniref:Uncharacterized protein n=1 Tax=Didymodactylos carnosus TaxID=1234261 RepID=A0A813Z4E9_9BILA|nr:unnamed protein product [Didymodactylos carnosus]CAF1026218.1 unnamed protein product [Didymodactylos carnosus]CAF3677142.1 unnamed protein product [Didymodactylos carnosus]CAF3794692.1 unnamed protein product [Didymodactylos carnosus]
MRRPDPYLIAMIVIGALILIAIGLATYATWYKSQIILLISGFVLIAIFILTLVFGIVRIVRSADSRSKPPSTTIKEGEKRDHYVLAEDVAKLVIELLSILFGILASFLLYRCIRADEYAEVSTISPSA